MRIFAIQNYDRYNNIKSTPQSRFIDTRLQTDTVTISPSFKSIKKLSEYFRGDLPYTPYFREDFEKILANMDLSGDTLRQLIEKAKKLKSSYTLGQTRNFNLDFLIRYISAEEIIDIPKSEGFAYGFSEINFDRKHSDKVRKLIEHFFQNCLSASVLHKSALENENAPLLTVLMKDMKGEYFKKATFVSYGVIECEMRDFAAAGRQAKNPAIRELFSGDNLYNFFKHPDLVPEELFKSSDFERKKMGKELLERTEPFGKRQLALDKYLCDGFFDNKFVLEELSTFPMTNFERYNTRFAAFIEKLKNRRLQDIVYRNGFGTAMNWLLCLKDKAMSEEILTQQYEGTTLIEEIANTKLESTNRDVMRKVVDELSKFTHLPDNDTYRKAALMAAEQGNLELLKLFDSRHIHYADIRYKPIHLYPQEVRETLKNAKYSIDDINSTDENGMNIAMQAVEINDLKTLESLAERDDFDWNMVDKYGDNLLMQIINKKSKTNNDMEFKKQAIKILRDLPEGKFDINYINYKPQLPENITLENRYKAYSALSRIICHGDFQELKDLLEEVLEFKGIDVTFDPTSDKPLSAQASQVKGVGEVLEKYADSMFLNKVKKFYDENGMFTLEEIKRIVDYPNFNNIAHEKINIIGENIGHFIAETYIDENNKKEVKTLNHIFNRLEKCDYDFNSKDDLDVTPLEKAIDCQNKIVASLIKEHLW